MVNALRIAGMVRGDWILTAYSVIVAAASLVPPALVSVEVLVHAGGAALGLVVVGSVLSAAIVYRCYFLALPIRPAATGELARRLGIPAVSRWLMNGTNLTALVRRHGSTELVPASRRTLQWVATRSVLAERVHAAAFVGTIPWIIAAYRFDAPALAAGIAVVNVLFQCYPVLVQRETRRRVQRLTRRMKEGDRRD
jgi:Zn-dependent protease with chaperone function